MADEIRKIDENNLGVKPSEYVIPKQRLLEEQETLERDREEIEERLKEIKRRLNILKPRTR